MLVWRWVMIRVGRHCLRGDLGAPGVGRKFRIGNGRRTTAEFSTDLRKTWKRGRSRGPLMTLGNYCGTQVI